MKKILASFFAFANARVRTANAFHDDTLRANQGGKAAAFSPWRALVGG